MSRSTTAPVEPSRAALGRPPGDWGGRPVWAEIDLDAVADNVRALKRLAGPARLLAVVKANGYGHGAVPVSVAALEAGATHLGVICVDEGVQLRAAGIEAPIVVLGHTPLRQAAEVVAQGLTPTVNSLRFGLALARLASENGRELAVHVKVDTGMGRFGSTPDDCVRLADSLRHLPSLRVEGIFTHFASADEMDKEFTRRQMDLFLSACDRLPWIPIRHAAASAALLDLPETALDLARPGIAIYGYAPGTARDRVTLRPVMALKSRLARVRQLEAGESVSYGRTWRAERPTPVGLVMAGYADGLPRSLSNRGAALVRGSRVPIIGRVCMDQCIVDLTAVPDAAEDDEVVLIGAQGKGWIGADEVGELAGTISYEILTGVTARVPRLFVRGGKVVRVQTLTGEFASEPD